MQNLIGERKHVIILQEYNAKPSYEMPLKIIEKHLQVDGTKLKYTSAALMASGFVSRVRVSLSHI